YVYEEEEQELFLEKLNLLYVATTRPTDSLYIICEKEGAFASLLSEYLQKEKVEPTEQLVYRLYKTDVYNIVKKQDADPQQINISYSLNEGFSHSRIFKIRVNERRYWQPRKLSEIEYGILLHDLLNSINSSVEAEEAASLFVNSHNLSDDVKNRLLRDLSNIVHNNKLRHFFEPGAYIFRETQISWKGNLKKPDRVVLNPSEKKVSILEIKTGQADSSHKIQVYQYAEVFEQIGYQVEQALIYYTETQTLVTIAP
ncbi:MAG: hypothetical protein NZ522_01750, partial [Chitinophagales bacterium]|nr:hypothetical protein [Chitinophagales bacterium]